MTTHPEPNTEARVPVPDPASPDNFSPVFIKRLLNKLSGVISVDAEQDPVTWAEEWQAAQELFWSLQPANAIEAVLAARAVDAHYRGLALSARAAQPGLSDDKALRLNTGINAAARTFDSALNRLEKWRRREPAAEPAPLPLPLFTAPPAASVAPPVTAFANRAERRAAAAIARKARKPDQATLQRTAA